VLGVHALIGDKQDVVGVLDFQGFVMGHLLGKHRAIGNQNRQEEGDAGSVEGYMHGIYGWFRGVGFHFILYTFLMAACKIKLDQSGSKAPL
jgi:hypothetical protein